MKYLGILILVVILGGCAGAPSLEQLEDQAMLSGDWSQVEKRERIIERRKARERSDCRRGFVSLCDKRIGEVRCMCVNRSDLRDVFSTL